MLQIKQGFVSESGQLTYRIYVVEAFWGFLGLKMAMHFFFMWKYSTINALLWDNTASTVQFSHFVYQLGVSINVHSSNFTTVVPQRIEGSRKNSMMSEILNFTQKPEILGVPGYNQMVCNVFLKSFTLKELESIRKFYGSLTTFAKNVDFLQYIL